MPEKRRFPGLLLFLLFAGFAALYIINIDGWLMHDDEGTDFYEIWQLQEGQQPGVDFIAEQQPLFLLAGKSILNIAGQNVLLLRLLAAVQVLAGAIFLSLVVRRVWGDTAAFLTGGLILTSGLVYEQARLFRPDPMMLGWEMAGIAAVLLAITKKRRVFWALAGGCYGIGILWKLFGVFPLVGLFFYFLYRLWHERAQWREVIMDGVFFSIPFLVFSLGVSTLLYGQLGFYYLEAFTYHLTVGQDNTLLHRVTVTASGYLFFILLNAAFIFILPLWFLNRRSTQNRIAEKRPLICQLLTPIIFLAVSRPIHLRYYFFLVPVFAILLAIEVQQTCQHISRQSPSFVRLVPVINVSVIIFAAALTQPGILTLLTREESDTKALAAYIDDHSQPEDIVLADYAGINFFAHRRSIYEASIIAGSQIDGQIITGELLIDRIEENDVSLVLIHIDGGEPPPHQLVNLVDYAEFREYLAGRFELLTVFDRAEQQIEVYRRKP